MSPNQRQGRLAGAGATSETRIVAEGRPVSVGDAEVRDTEVHPMGWRMLAYLMLPAVSMYLFIDAMRDVPRTQKSEQLARLLNENGVLEWTQVGVVLVILAFCVHLALRERSTLYSMFAVLCVVTVAREMDVILEQLFFDRFHSLIVKAGGVVLLAVGVRWRAALRREVPALLRTRGFRIMVFGVFMMYVYAQILGQRHLWKVVAHPPLVSEAKRVVEENLELGGYLLVLCGLFENRFFSRPRRSGHAPGGA